MERVINTKDIEVFKHRLYESIEEYGKDNRLDEEEMDLLTYIAEGFVKNYLKKSKTYVTDNQILSSYIDNLEDVFGTHHHFNEIPEIKKLIQEAAEIESDQIKELVEEMAKNLTEEEIAEMLMEMITGGKLDEKTLSAFNDAIDKMRDPSYYGSAAPKKKSTSSRTRSSSSRSSGSSSSSSYSSGSGYSSGCGGGSSSGRGC